MVGLHMAVWSAYYADTACFVLRGPATASL